MNKNTFIINIMKNKISNDFRFCVGIRDENLFNEIVEGNVNSILVEVNNETEIYNVRTYDLKIGKGGKNDIVEIHYYPSIGGALDYEKCVEFYIKSIQNKDTIPLLEDNQVLINI